MPLVKIEISDGKSADYKKQLLDGVHTALVNSIGIADSDRFQRLYELPNEHFEKNASKTNNFTIIEIVMFAGRSKEQKARMYEEIVNELHNRLGIANTDIFIYIHEPPNENWGLAGKQR